MGNLRFVVYGLVFFGFAWGQDAEEFANFLEKEMKEAWNYKLPVDASEYKPKTVGGPNDFGSFDFIIVGSGSGGSVVANRLSEISNWTILLLEAGGYGNNFSDVPNMYLPIELSHFNWGYHSIPQNSSCLGMIDQKCPLPRGKGIGGTTLINGLVYSRGHKMDYDKWASIGNPGWSYNDLLPYFKKSENFNPRPPVEAPYEEEYHGKGGYLNVEYLQPLNKQLHKFLQANEEIGIPTADYNANRIGASPSQINTKDGRRFDDGKAFIRSVENQRKNLKVMTNSFVTKVNLKKRGKKISVSGVTFTNKGSLYTAKATKEVILSAGAYNTPHILLHSGIGPRKHLQEMNIPLNLDLEVGSKLKDHAAYYGLSVSTNLSSEILPFVDYVEEFLNGTGILTAPGGNDGVAFYESSFTRGTGYPDIEIMFVGANATNEFSQKAFGLSDSTYESVWKNVDKASSFIFYIVALHSESQGTVRLKSKNPFEYPVIDTQFLTDSAGKDIQTLYEGIELCLQLLKTKAFKSINATLQTKPFQECNHIQDTLSKEYFFCAIRVMTFNIYHPVSSCPMGSNPKNGDVVDSQLRVHGIPNLRVIDASVFPFTLAGHPNAAVVVVAEKGSDLIKESYR